MHKSRVIVIFAALILVLTYRASADEIVNVGRGNILVHVPPAYDPAEPTPLVLLLHGYGANGPSQEAYMQFTPLADEIGFIYAYPSGTLDNNNARFWNATDACCNFFGSTVDDSGYLLELIDAIKAILTVDEDRVHLIGHSNGGFMSYRMACDHPDVIASIASLAGASWKDPSDCLPSSPVHVLQIHGTADNVVLYNGGTFVNPYPGAVESVEQWATFGGCSLVADTSAAPLDLDAGIAGAESTVTRYESGCNSGGSSELWTIQGGSHSPNLSADFSRLVIEYLYAHPKNAPTCLAGAVNSGAGAIEDVLFLNGSNGGPTRTVAVTGGQTISGTIALPSAGGNGKFVVHVNDGSPVPSGQVALPADIGPACFPFLFPEATPIAIWNNIGKINRIGATQYFDATPLPDPDRAPTTFVEIIGGDAVHLPPGTTVSFQAVIFDPGSDSPKRASASNTVILAVQ